MPVFQSKFGQAPAWCELEYFEILSLNPDDSNELLWRGRKEKIFVSEGRHYPVGPGDCVATGMGHHHDFVRVEEPIRGVYFKTTLEEKKRLGHLWNHTHGPAEPRWERA